jgi:hypothetical protein
MKISSSRLLVVLVLSAACGPALAWGPEGHETVGYIAQDRLSPAARAGIQELLGSGADLASVAPWADEYREQDRSTTGWHFINLEVTQNADLGGEMAACRSHGKDDDCVVDQIQEDAEIVGNTKLPQAQRATALMFLVHFVGDLHQPLHCADDEDYGGNDKHVVFTDADGSSHLSLHQVWDRMVGLRAPGGARGLATELEGQISPQAVTTWASGTPGAWALESYQIAKTQIYAGMTPGATRRGQDVHLPAGYASAMQPIVAIQLEKAGIRLAWILNGIFAAPAR